MGPLKLLPFEKAVISPLYLSTYMKHSFSRILHASEIANVWGKPTRFLLHDSLEISKNPLFEVSKKLTDLFEFVLLLDIYIQL